MIRRRDMLAWMGVAMALPSCITMKGETVLEEVQAYGIIGQMKVSAGKRDELIAILTEGNPRYARQYQLYHLPR